MVVTFKLNFSDALQESRGDYVTVIFSYDNPHTNQQTTRSIKYGLNKKRQIHFKHDLKAYIDFLLEKNMLTKEMLLFGQKKLLQSILFKYPQNYPHTRVGANKNVERFFRTKEYKLFANKNGNVIPVEDEKGKVISHPSSMDTEKYVSKYPSRILAPFDDYSESKTVMCLGSSFSGKTYWLTDELSRVKEYEYDLIILFTESVNAKPLQKLRERPDLIIKEGFDESIPNFLKNLNNKLKLRFRFLLILDDIIGENSSRQSVLGRMITIFRNSGINTVFLSQYPTLIQKHCRGNFHFIVNTGFKTLESNDAFASRFDVLSWAKVRMQKEERFQRVSIRKEEILNFLKELLREPGMIIFIDNKHSLDPALVDLR